MHDAPYILQSLIENWNEEHSVEAIKLLALYSVLVMPWLWASRPLYTLIYGFCDFFFFFFWLIMNEYCRQEYCCINLNVCVCVCVYIYI